MIDYSPSSINESSTAAAGSRTARNRASGVSRKSGFASELASLMSRLSQAADYGRHAEVHARIFQLRLLQDAVRLLEQDKGDRELPPPAWSPGSSRGRVSEDRVSSAPSGAAAPPRSVAPAGAVSSSRILDESPPLLPVEEVSSFGASRSDNSDGPGSVGRFQLYSSGSSPYDAIIRRAAERHGVEPALVKAVVKAESGFDARIVSSAGAEGLMQLMPETARELGVTDSFDPAENIMAGTRYLKQLLDRYDGDLEKSLAAYNWGPGNVDRRGTAVLPGETREYLVRVKGYYADYRATG